MKKNSSLEKFRIRPSSQTGMLGSFVASHAIRNSLVFLAVGIGCKGQMPPNASRNDNNENYFSRMGWSQFDEEDYITGNMEKIKRNILGQLNRFDAGFIPVVISPVVKIIGMDVKSHINELKKELSPVIEYVELSNINSDFWEGYTEVMKSFSKTINWNRKYIEKGTANIWGYPFDRYEEEHMENIILFKRYLKDLGIKIHSIFFSGVNSENLRHANKAQYNIILPHAARIGKFLEQSTQRRSIYMDLPLGISATKKWINRISNLNKDKKDKIERKFIKELERAEKAKEEFIKRNKHKKVGIIVDTPYIGSMCSFLRETGFDIELIITKDRSFGGKEIVEKLLEYHEMISDKIHIEETPTLNQIIDKVKECNIDVLIGSDNDLSFTKKDLEDTRLTDLKTFTFGFPSFDKHYTKKDSSFLFYEGFINFAKEITEHIETDNRMMRLLYHQQNKQK